MRVPALRRHATSRSRRSGSAPGRSPATGGATSRTSRGCCTPRSTRASTSSTPRRSTAEDGVGETLLARRPEDAPRRHRPHHQVRLRASTPSGCSPVSRSARRTGARRRSDCSSRGPCAGSAPTTSTSTSCTTRASSPSRTTPSGRCSRSFADEGKIREIGVALGPAIGWVEEGLESIRNRPIASLQTVFNIIEQEPGLTFAARDPRRRQEHRLDLAACPTRRTRSPAGSPATPSSRPRTTARTATATTCSTTSTRPRRCRSSGTGTGRTLGQAAVAGILANPTFTTVLPTNVDVDDVREYAAASDMPLTADEAARVDELFARQLRHPEPLRDAPQVEPLTGSDRPGLHPSTG